MYAQSNIESDHKYSEGALVTWLDWRCDSENGAVVEADILVGFIWVENVGWIDVDGAGNIIVTNTAMNNSVANCDIATGNSYGPILHVGAGGDLCTLSSGDQPTANVSLICPTWCGDADGDGYGDPADTQQTCAQSAGYVSDCPDCNDTNNAINPGATEFCNSVDDDCDQTIDEGCPPPYHLCRASPGEGAADGTDSAFWSEAIRL